MWKTSKYSLQKEHFTFFTIITGIFLGLLSIFFFLYPEALQTLCLGYMLDGKYWSGRIMCMRPFMPTSWSEKSLSHGSSSECESSELVQPKEDSSHFSWPKLSSRPAQNSLWHPFFQLPEVALTQSFALFIYYTKMIKSNQITPFWKPCNFNSALQQKQSQTERSEVYLYLGRSLMTHFGLLLSPKG